VVDDVGPHDFCEMHFLSLKLVIHTLRYCVIGVYN